jgi:hypothetical protein
MTVMLYAHHVVHDPQAMMEGAAGANAALSAAGHDWSEDLYADADMRHVLIVARFGSSTDLATHFRLMEEQGFAGLVGTVFDFTSVDVVGDVDDDARAALAFLGESVHFLSAPPES